MKHNSMEAAVKEHLDTRRQLGFALVASGTELMRFARYADARGHLGPLNQDLILGWAREHVKKTSAVTPARRLKSLDRLLLIIDNLSPLPRCHHWAY